MQIAWAAQKSPLSPGECRRRTLPSYAKPMLIILFAVIENRWVKRCAFAVIKKHCWYPIERARD